MESAERRIVFGHLDENKRIIMAKLPITIGDRVYFTEDPDLMLQAGEKRIIYTTKPTEEQEKKGRYVLTWEEGETEITQVWNYVEYNEAELKAQYISLCNKKIRSIYSQSDEDKINRKYLAYGDQYKAKFEEYNNNVEKCLDEAYMEVYGVARIRDEE